MGGVRDGYSNFKFFDVIAPDTTNGAQAVSGVPVDKQGYETITFLFAIKTDVSGTVSGAYPSVYSGYFLRMTHGNSNAAGVVVYSNCQASHMLIDVTMSGQMSGVSDTSMGWMQGNSNGSGVSEGIFFHFGISQSFISYIESKVWAAGYIGDRRWIRVHLSCSAAADVSTIGFACFAIGGLEANWPINDIKVEGPPTTNR
jgi:hypothetical protein